MKKIFSIFLFSLIVSSFSFAKDSDYKNADAVTKATVLVKEDGKAINVGNRICPVSGETIGENSMEPATYEYEEKIYNFCCSSCIEEFKKDPKKYILKVEEELKNENNQK